MVYRQATMVSGGHQWLWVMEKKVLGFGWEFGEKKSENCIFHSEEHIYNL